MRDQMLRQVPPPEWGSSWGRDVLFGRSSSVLYNIIGQRINLIRRHLTIAVARQYPTTQRGIVVVNDQDCRIAGKLLGTILLNHPEVLNGTYDVDALVNEALSQYNADLCQALQLALAPLPMIQRMVISAHGCVGLDFQTVSEIVGRVTPEHAEQLFDGGMAELSNSPLLEPFIKDFESIKELLSYIGISFPTDQKSEEKLTQRIYEKLGIDISQLHKAGE